MLPPIDIDEFQPIDERKSQGNKRQRSESPQIVQNKRFEGNTLDGTIHDETLLNSAMDQQESQVKQSKDLLDYTL